jgi:hypothetical protein
VTAPAVERPSPGGVGRGSSAPAGDCGSSPAGARAELASAYARGLALHRWGRDRAARQLAGQLILFALEPEDFVQDPDPDDDPGAES